MELYYTLENIDQAAKQFWYRLNNFRIFAFNGEMGAGKTTFIRKLCDYLRVEDVVSSPTFALINEYHFTDKNDTDNIIYHLDLYRLKGTEEAIYAGMEDCIGQARNGTAFCFIEWPEKAKELLKPPYAQINIESVGGNERKMMALPVEV